MTEPVGGMLKTSEVRNSDKCESEVRNSDKCESEEFRKDKAGFCPEASSHVW